MRGEAGADSARTGSWCGQTMLSPAHVTHGHGHALEFLRFRTLRSAHTAATRNMGFLLSGAIRESEAQRFPKRFLLKIFRQTCFLSLNDHEFLFVLTDLRLENSKISHFNGTTLKKFSEQSPGHPDVCWPRLFHLPARNCVSVNEENP